MGNYDIESLVRYCIHNGVKISPPKRQDRAMFCCALKVLNYDVNTFVALSNEDDAKCRAVWTKEKNPERYSTEDSASAKIVALAREAGIDVRQIGKSSASTWTPRPAPQPVTPEQDKPRCYVPLDFVERAATQVEASALFIFLCRLFPKDDVRRVMQNYLVGASASFVQFWPNDPLASAFPIINADGQIIDVHLMAYDQAGKRRKTDDEAQMWKCQNWLLAKWKKKDFRAPWCLFGEHLTVKYPERPIGIVESEKTALIASIVAPSFVWCATLSLSNLNSRRLAGVKDRVIYLFPDMDGIEQWEQKAVKLRQEGFNRLVVCSDYIRRFAQAEKDDLADIILNYSPL